MADCLYHPIYRVCRHCGSDMQRSDKRECVELPVGAATYKQESDCRAVRVAALRLARSVILKHAMSTWRAGLTERSDGITEVLVDFDLEFPGLKE